VKALLKVLGFIKDENFLGHQTQVSLSRMISLLGVVIMHGCICG
jgi:hypothetical protein